MEQQNQLPLSMVACSHPSPENVYRGSSYDAQWALRHCLQPTYLTTCTYTYLTYNPPTYLTTYLYFPNLQNLPKNLSTYLSCNLTYLTTFVFIFSEAEHYLPVRKMSPVFKIEAVNKKKWTPEQDKEYQLPLFSSAPINSG